MPAMSRAEERYLYATKGAAWVQAHHFNTPMAGLPERAPKKKRVQTDAITQALARRG